MNKHMMKNISIIVLVVSVATFLSGCENRSQDEIAQLQEIVKNNEQMSNTPQRTPEINGVVISVEGNKIIVKNEIGRKPLTAEEQAKKRAERQKLSPEERRALREQETANLKVENVTIEIPAGIAIVKGSGKADGTNIKANFSDIKIGAYISIWTNGEKVEAIKIKGV